MADQDPYAEFGGIPVGPQKPKPAAAPVAAPAAQPAATPAASPAPAQPAQPAADPYAEFGGVPLSSTQPSQVTKTPAQTAAEKEASDQALLGISADAQANVTPDVSKEAEQKVRGQITGAVKGLVETGHMAAAVADRILRTSTFTGGTPAVPFKSPDWLEAHGGAEASGKVAEGVLEFFLGDAALKTMSLTQKLAEATKLTTFLEKYPELAKALHVGTSALRMGTASAGQSLAHGATGSEALQAGAETALLGGTLEGAGAIRRAPGVGPILKAAAAATEAGVGASVAVKGSKQALTPQQPGETSEQSVARRTGGAIQAALGAGGVVGAAPGVSETAGKVKEALGTPKPTAEEAVGKTFQVTGKDRETAMNAVKALKTGGVDLKTIQEPVQLRDAFDKKVQENTKQVDQILSKNESVFTADDLKQKFPVPGSDKVIEKNPAMDALDQLGTHYDKVNDAAEQARVEGLKAKLQTQGLTLQELNGVAREMGTVLSNFNERTGELASGLKPQAVEKTRSDLKEQIRAKMPDDQTRALDEQTSDLIHTRDKTDKMIGDLEKLQNKLQRASGWQKFAGKAADVTNLVTGDFFKKVMGMSKTGDTTLNVEQIAQRMPRNLALLDELLSTGVKPDEALRQFENMITLPEPAPKSGTAVPKEGTPPKAGGAGVAPATGTPKNLGVEYDKPRISGDLPRGMSIEATMGHELGHAHVLNQLGFTPIDVISKSHPEILSSRTAAQTRVDWGRDLNSGPDGLVETSKIKDRLDDIITAHLAGAAANELYHGIPYAENHGLAADLRGVHGILDNLGFTDTEKDDIIKSNLDRAKSMLTDKHVTNVINEFSGTREPNLPDTHHYSAGRIQEFLDRIEGGPDEGNKSGDVESGKQLNKVGEPGAKEGDQRVPAAAAATPEAVRVPPERTTGSEEIDKAIKTGGAVPGGKMEGLALFHDPKTGSTLALKLEDITPEAVKKQLSESRAKFGVKETASDEAEARHEKFKAEASKEKEHFDQTMKRMFGDVQAEGPLNVAAGADAFNAAGGRPPIEASTKEHDPEFAARVADAYDKLKHNPDDPEVKASYGAMKRDIRSQWDYANDKMGVKFEPWETSFDYNKSFNELKKAKEQPYANSKEMTADVKDNHHLYFFQGGEMAPNHPLAEIDPETGYSYNDMLRAVHDLFGHAAHGFQFGPKGEENAYLVHRQMFSPEAIPALTSETRAQNSWFNYGSHLRNAEGKVIQKGEPGYVPPPERPFAENKAALLPKEFQRGVEPKVNPADKFLMFASPEEQAKPFEPGKWNNPETENYDWTKNIDLKKDPAGGINPRTASMTSDRYGVEVYPEVTEVLDHPPTPEDFKRYAQEHADILAKHPELRVGWDTTGDKPIMDIGVSSNNLEAVKKLGAALDQRSVWDTLEKKEIFTGGSGTQREFKDYPLEQRLADLKGTPLKGLEARGSTSAQEDEANEILGRIGQNFGLSSDASKTRDGASFITPEGKFIHLGHEDHPQVLDRFGYNRDSMDDRVPFINETGAIRSNFTVGKAGPTLSFSVPENPTESQIDAMKAAVQKGLGRNGQLRIETASNPKNIRTQMKDFATANDVEPMLAALKAPPKTGPLGGLAATSDRISTRVPTAKKATEDVMAAEPLTVGLDAVRKAPGLMDKLANEVRDYPGGKVPANIKDPEKVVVRHIDRVADNLKWLYNQVPESTRSQTRKWYESANKLAKGMADKHGLSESQGAGVIAALSPQKPWDMNVSLARRVSDIYHEQGDTAMTPEMMATGVKITTDPKTAGTNENLAAVLGDLKDKKLSELTDPYQKAAWIRLYDETYNPREFPRIDPGTGEDREIQKNDDGSSSGAAWGSLNQIAKTLSIMDNGSRENVSKEMGMAHKVRNFYNNIVDPSNDKDVTIDTHAVAAGLLRPLAGNDKPVTKNFGGISASAVGSKGTYPLYAEAYRKAAAEIGIKPRELQSVVWEKIRDLFTDTFKTKENKAAVDNLWKQYDDKKMSLEQVRNAIVDLAEKAKTTQKQRPQSAFDFLGMGEKTTPEDRAKVEEAMAYLRAKAARK